MEEKKLQQSVENIQEAVRRMLDMRNTGFMPDENTKQLGKLIEITRIKKNVTRQELAELANIKRNLVATIELGWIDEATLPTVKALIDCLNINHVLAKIIVDIES